MKKAVTIVFALLLTSAMMWGSTPFTTSIYVQNGTDKDTLTLGVAACATINIDACAGEQELPPVPPDDVFDSRFKSIGSSQNIGQGLSTDIRHLTSDLQTDTFKLAFKTTSEAGGDVTLTWSATLGTMGGGYWLLTDNLNSADATMSVDMTEESTVTFDASGDLATLYIIKADAATFRTFSLSDLALDGSVDAKGKISYGKSYKPKADKVEFSVTFKNNESGSATNLHVEFGVAVTVSSLEINKFTTAVNVKGTKWDFSGATIAMGDSVTIHAFGAAAKSQKVSKWYWANGTTLVGVAKKTQTVTNDLRNPMPNTVNAGEEMWLQTYPPKGKGNLNVGIVGATKTDKPWVSLASYAVTLKALVNGPGKEDKEYLQNGYASCLDKLDKVKASGDRGGKVMAGEQKGLGPDKHRNGLLGQAITLLMNLKFSATEKTPAGLGAVLINDATSPFNGKSLDTLLAQTNQYLTYCSVGKSPAVTASDLLDELTRVNEAFNGDLDTISWGLTKTKFTGAKSIGSVSFLKRNPAALTPSENAPDFINNVVPEAFSLNQNYPNPFNPSTTISFNLPVDGLVSIKVFNLLGQQVATIYDRQELNSGANEVTFNASSLSSGVYFYRLSVNNISTGEVTFTDLKKMIYLK